LFDHIDKLVSHIGERGVEVTKRAERGSKTLWMFCCDRGVVEYCLGYDPIEPQCTFHGEVRGSVKDIGD